MGWSRPNTAEAEFKLDRFECEQQAARLYPVVIASIGSGHEAPSPANCSSYAGHMNCTATSGSYVAPRPVNVNTNAPPNQPTSSLQSKPYSSKPINPPSTSH